MADISGHGSFFQAPEEIKKWNWGAFWLTWIWGYFNNTFISFLFFIPVVNLFIPFYLGFKGNELAWQNTTWLDKESFLKAQKKWAVLGWIMMVVFLILGNLIYYNETSIREQEDYIYSESTEMITGSIEAYDFVGHDFEIIEYIRGSHFIFWETTHSIILQSSKGKYWAAVRLDTKGEINEILVSHYYVIEGFREVIITK